MGASPVTRLRTELDLFEANKAQWLQSHRGQFVVIKGSQRLGFFPEFHQAYRAGVEKYGMDTDFLVKRVVAQEPVFVVF